ncbi:putative inorganic phosphate cotransporter [Sitodiplosis mosellana]|uniref:putative inorganic phosphate cotransporter n=1 Tax=Sitodiplosis mosellana TaxID=263140 RepID=UPI002444B3F6|nr:putative inorganic phosphate cotransporter [Sitodiplosis mosellana]
MNPIQISLAANMKKSHNLCTFLPQRVIVGIMGFFAIAAQYTIRQCLSVAITAMTVKIDEPGGGHKMDAKLGDRYEWSQTLQGWILSSFYIGYVITHIPGGLIAEKFGGKWTMALGIFVMAILNALTPLAIEFGGHIALITIRIAQGLAGGTTYPALSVMLAAWVPEKERGKLGSVVFGGGQIGSLVSFAISGVISDRFHWSMVFYFWSVIAIIWFILFVAICYNDPDSHPHITQKELDYLKKEMGQTKRNDDMPPTPWMSILTSVPVFALICGQIGHDWIFYIMSADMPKYLTDVLKFTTTDAGLYSALPYLVMWVFSIVSGFVSDFLIVRNITTITQARKIFTALGGVFPAIFLVGASYAGNDKVLIILLFTLTMGFLGNFYPGLKVNALDLSPNYAGSLMALTNGIGGITGVLAPPFVGLMAPQSTLEQWRFVFWITFGVSIVRIIIFVMWGSAEIQPWNNPQSKTSPESGTQNKKEENGNTSEDRKGENCNTSRKRYDSEHLHDEIRQNNAQVFTTEKSTRY